MLIYCNRSGFQRGRLFVRKCIAPKFKLQPKKFCKICPEDTTIIFFSNFFMLAIELSEMVGSVLVLSHFLSKAVFTWAICRRKNASQGCLLIPQYKRALKEMKVKFLCVQMSAACVSVGKTFSMPSL
jgi:hypothetical protein